MPRPLRIEFEHALYHVSARGNEKKAVFVKNADHEAFLGLVEEVGLRFSLSVHGYVLMKNHYHLLLETAQPNLSKAMHCLNTNYSKYFNYKHGRVGHLFQGRYRAHLVEKDDYLVAVSRYIHLNPVRAKLVTRPEEYRWSSYGDFVGRGEGRKWLCTSAVLGQFSGDLAQAKALYRDFVESGIGESSSPLKRAAGGLIIGSEGFVAEMGAKIAERTDAAPALMKFSGSTRPGAFDEVVAAVSEALGVRKELVFEARRPRNMARDICMHLLRASAGMGNAEIARRFSVGRSEVSRRLARVRGALASNEGLRRTVAEIERRLPALLDPQ